MNIKDDLFLAVNGLDLQSMEIPDDKPMYGNFIRIDEDVERTLMNDIVKMKDGNLPLTNTYQKEMIAFYKQAMDYTRKEKESWDPFRPYIKKIESLKDFKELVDFSTKNILVSFPINLSVSSDMKNATTNTVYVSGANTFLPDKTYYEETHPNGALLLNVAKEQVRSLLLDYGYPQQEAEEMIEEAFYFDRQFKDYTKTSIERSNYAESYNPRSIEEVEAYSSHMSLKTWISTILNQDVMEVIVENPNYFEHLNEFFHPNNFKAIQSWMIVCEFLSVGALLSEDIREKSSVYTKALTGNTAISTKEKHAYRLVSSTFKDVLGDYYGKTYFGQEAKKDVEDMVARIIDTYRKRLSRNTWLSKETIEKAITKLNKIEVLIGYPSEIDKVYSHVHVDETKSFYENYMHIREVFELHQLAQYKKPVDRSKWEMGAHDVNAYYHPFNNLICFPAGILQSPFYSLSQGDSKNYGGIGAVIAHEISHAFDNNGAKFDEFGNLNNWWKEEDFNVFHQKAQQMIDLWNTFTTADGKVSGELTVSENIADLGGLACALESLKQKEGYCLKDFFTNWARVWCLKVRPEFAQLLLQMDVHAPASLRANITPRHFDEFYQTFEVTSEHQMYLKPEHRITIW